MKIRGKVIYQDLSGGFWGIIDSKGNSWKPVEMPTELKKEGLAVELKAKKTDGVMSIFMWGTSIKILEFNIL